MLPLSIEIHNNHPQTVALNNSHLYHSLLTDSLGEEFGKDSAGQYWLLFC